MFNSDVLPRKQAKFCVFEEPSLRWSWWMADRWVEMEVGDGQGD